MSRRAGNRKKDSRYNISMAKGENSPSRLFKKIDYLIRQAEKSRRKNNSELSLTGRIMSRVSKEETLIYGFSIKLEKATKK
jgi:hypothetical protein